MTGYNFSDQDEVLAWVANNGDEPGAACIAKAMRYKAVWEAHRDRLTHVSDTRRYNTINRQTMAKAIQAFCYAMARAEEGSGGD